jgi:hypothetical protein
MPTLVWYTPAFQEFNHLLQALEMAQGGGLGVELVDREVFMHEPHPIAARGYQLSERRLHALTEGTVEVLKHDDGHRHRCWSFGEAPSVVTWARKTGGAWRYTTTVAWARRARRQACRWRPGA